MKAKTGDIFTTYNQCLGRYTACQIVRVGEKNILRLELDWSGAQPLREDQMANLRPLYKDFMYWQRTLCLLHVDPEVPDYFLYVGNLPPLTDEDNTTYGSWDDGYDVCAQLSRN